MESSFSIGNDLQERYFTSGGEAGLKAKMSFGVKLFRNKPDGKG
jgi:hypothetical protein